MIRIIFLILLFISSNCFATDHYVSTSGSNSNDGSLGSPWATCQKAADNTLAGETTYFRGGTYSQQLNCNFNTNSGTAGNYITFQNYPSETPIFDGSWSPTWTLQGSNIWVSNDPPAASGFTRYLSNGAAGSSTFLTLVNTEAELTNNTVWFRDTSPNLFRLKIYSTTDPNLLTWHAACPSGLIDLNGVSYIKFIGLTVQFSMDGFRSGNSASASHLVFQNNTVLSPFRGFMNLGEGAYPSTDVTLTGNYVQNSYDHCYKLGQNITFDGTSMDYLTWDHNTAKNCGYHGFQASNGSGHITASYNTVDTTGIRNPNSDSSGIRFGSTDVGYIYGNTITNAESGISLAKSNGMTRSAQNILVYQNTVSNSTLNGIWEDVVTDSNNYIYNNIVVNSGTYNYRLISASNQNFLYNTLKGAGLQEMRIGSGCTNNNLKGNIAYGTSATDYGVIYIGTDSNNTDYNIYYNGSATPVAYNSIGVSLASLQASTGGDAHSIASDPLIFSNYRLQANSPAINAGVTIAQVTTDYSGVPRTSGQYDIGAFQLVPVGISGMSVSHMSIQ